MGRIDIKPSRTRDVMDIAGFYADRDTLPAGQEPVNRIDHKGLNRKQRRIEKAKLRKLGLL